MMLFELINASISFQNYINHALREFIDFFVIIYLNDILVFSANLHDHIKHVRLILKRLIKYKLYAKLEKCRFHLKEVNYLDYLIDSTELRMKLEKIKTIMK